LAKFEELSKYKNTIMLKLLESQNICKALFYNETNFLNKDDIEDTSILVYDNIYPHFFVPNVDDTAKTYLSIHFKRFRPISNVFKQGLIFISIFTHKSLFKTDYGVTRVDFLLNKIDEIMNKQRGFGLGKLELYEMDEFSVNNSYSGAYLSYKPVDFN